VKSWNSKHGKLKDCPLYELMQKMQQLPRAAVVFCPACPKRGCSGAVDRILLKQVKKFER
jgi:hypothetical protein